MSTIATPSGASAPITPPVRPTFGSVFTSEQVDSFNANYEQNWGLARRFTSVMLQKTADELIESVSELMDDEGGMDVLRDIQEQLANYLEHAKATVDAAENALARVLLAAQYLATVKQWAKTVE